MRYQLSNGERGKDSRKDAKQPARLENRGPKGTSSQVRHRILATRNQPRRLSSSKRKKDHSSSGQTHQGGIRQAVSGPARRFRMTQQALDQYPFQVRPLTKDEGGGY